MFDVISLGILVADIITRPLKEYPSKGRLVLVDEMELHSGGCALNTGIALSKVGIKVGVIGKVGCDAHGDFLITEMKKYNVNTSGVVRDKNVSTSATLVLVSEDGERSFIHYLGADGEFCEKDVNMNLIKKTKILHLAGFFVMPKFDGKPTLNILKKAKKLGITTSLDTVWDTHGRWMKLLEPCLPYVDIFLPSIEEAKRLTNKDRPEEIAKEFISYGIKKVALKMSDKGCYIRSENEEHFIPPYKVKVVDTTGAGDCFVAGFLAGEIWGWDLEKCGKFANVLGAQCVQSIGASAGVSNKTNALKFMKQKEKKELI